MKRILLAFAALSLCAAAPLPAPHWSHAQVERLIEWLVSAADDGLGSVTPEAALLRERIAAGDEASLDAEATRVAVRLVNAYRDGCCNASLRSGWRISPTPAWGDATSLVADAVSANRLDQLFLQSRPSHPFYEGLRRAYRLESNAGRRATLAANMDRWRWMPRDLGSRYLLVNAAAFEASLWDHGQLVGRWKVVVGKSKSPTPIFAAQVSGVIFNPWWEIPPSIAAEGVASMVRNRPAVAAGRGYVLENGRYRQRPGANNALGRMKLVMPNSYNVYLHDTPSQSLFARDVRAFSHGCVRVEDALGLATTLVSARPGWDRAQVDAVIEKGETIKVDLPNPVPVYVTYFTAEPDALGAIRYFPDVYHRDRGAKSPTSEGTCL
ncbi:L,D-transpeptidase family protein [Sphingobium nicotianae]|uniref:L,D-transpeptidase family protein n=1 Tax=Sphingobium nicotianae TaxID=2782607 RepID=A0A9X1ISF9_9SPHN|nr:L,D-transpeptidase family protein [Sphingobium nicotianae]MBT2188367.1 L,D-transpeptidase family protein [Sphingobium nicotianae]